MRITTFSQVLQQVSRSNSPYYHPLQVTLFASLSYLGTAFLTKISPFRGAILTTAAYVVSQASTPIFVQSFEPFRDYTLVPFIGQVTQLTISFTMAKIICNMIGYPYSFNETKQVAVAFFITLFIAHFTFNQFINQKNRHNII